MIRDFFIDKFEFDLACNQVWIKKMQSHENEIDDFIQRSFSHVINVHHRWVSRLEGKNAESGLFDRLPINHWPALINDNYQRTIQYIEHSEFKGVINYYDDDGDYLEKEVVDVLYHMLNHSNYHRAQIALRLRELGIEPPSLNFIAFRTV